MTAGQEFVKKIGPFGSILILILFIAFLIICFIPPKQAEDGPSAPPVESGFYSESPAVFVGEALL